MSGVVRGDRRAVDVDIARDLRRRAFAEVVVREMLVGADVDVAEQIAYVEPRAAAVADVGIEIEVAASADVRGPQYSPGRRSVNSYSPLASVSVVAMTLPSPSSRSICTPAIGGSPIVRIALGIGRDDDLAADRAGQQLAEVVLDAHLAPVDHDLADHVARRRRAAMPPRLPGVSMPSSQPLGCTSITEYLPARRLLNL